MNQDIGAPIKSEEVCLECGSSRLKEDLKEQKFPYGPPTAQTILTASIPVFTCQDCGYEFFDERGESARHEAVCRHLGVQTPDEIRSVREAAGLGRAEFCKIGGFGIASLQRWETGEVIPNMSSDRLIYLLRHHENINRLRARDCAGVDQASGVATPTQSAQIEERSGNSALKAHKWRIRTRDVSHFPTLEKQGELARWQQAAERIQRRGCFLAPVA